MSKITKNQMASLIKVNTQGDSINKNKIRGALLVADHTDKEIAEAFKEHGLTRQVSSFYKDSLLPAIEKGQVTADQLDTLLKVESKNVQKNRSYWLQILKAQDATIERILKAQKSS